MKSRITTKRRMSGTIEIEKFIVELQVKPMGKWIPVGDGLNPVLEFDTQGQAEVAEFCVMKPKGARHAGVNFPETSL